jgi:hypothetical protein
VHSDLAGSSFDGTANATQNAVLAHSDLATSPFGEAANVIQNAIDVHSIELKVL